MTSSALEKLKSLSPAQKAAGLAAIAAALCFITLPCIGLGGWLLFRESPEQKAKREQEELAKKFQDAMAKALSPIQPIKPPREIKFYAPGDTVNLDGVTVELLRGRIGKITLSSGYIEPEPGLQLDLRITNTTETSIVEYSAWAQDHTVRLTDDFDNVYPLRTFGYTSKVKGRDDLFRIKPRTSGTEIVVFEPPLEKATTFKVALRASAFLKKRADDFGFKFDRTWLGK